jgi:nucleoside-diphosphate kinase
MEPDGEDRLNRTLLILKPDSIERRLMGKILAMVEETGLRIRRMEMLRLSPERARSFYAEHEGKPFLSDLVDYMASGPCVAVVLEGEEAVTRLRELMGATDPAQAAAGTIRAQYGVSIQTNSVHGSDSPGSARREVRFFFPEEP